MYVFWCKLSLVRLCDSDFGITPVDDITIEILLLLNVVGLLTSLRPSNRVSIPGAGNSVFSSSL